MSESLRQSPYVRVLYPTLRVITSPSLVSDLTCHNIRLCPVPDLTFLYPTLRVITYVRYVCVLYSTLSVTTVRQRLEPDLTFHNKRIGRTSNGLDRCGMSHFSERASNGRPYARCPSPVPDLMCHNITSYVRRPYVGRPVPDLTCQTRPVHYLPCHNSTSESLSKRPVPDLTCHNSTPESCTRPNVSNGTSASLCDRLYVGYVGYVSVLTSESCIRPNVSNITSASYTRPYGSNSTSASCTRPYVSNSTSASCTRHNRPVPDRTYHNIYERPVPDLTPAPDLTCQKYAIVLYPTFRVITVSERPVPDLTYHNSTSASCICGRPSAGSCSRPNRPRPLPDLKVKTTLRVTAYVSVLFSTLRVITVFRTYVSLQYVSVLFPTLRVITVRQRLYRTRPNRPVRDLTPASDLTCQTLRQLRQRPVPDLTCQTRPVPDRTYHNIYERPVPDLTPAPDLTCQKYAIVLYPTFRVITVSERPVPDLTYHNSTSASCICGRPSAGSCSRPNRPRPLPDLKVKTTLRVTAYVSVLFSTLRVITVFRTYVSLQYVSVLFPTLRVITVRQRLYRTRPYFRIRRNSCTRPNSTKSDLTFKYPTLRVITSPVPDLTCHNSMLESSASTRPNRPNVRCHYVRDLYTIRPVPDLRQRPYVRDLYPTLRVITFVRNQGLYTFRRCKLDSGNHVFCVSDS
ncbi:hypothetical protein DPMN_081251 [Dreissena polymorpha]|uniref:Uncharacterized protein n=1 Tax=Dreissena polymorpha TaxID=45954 RepID=A0A9D3Y4L2_DREPO|nr:hypothetical protein DPMN_081251 [Dreissena polymorpha]